MKAALPTLAGREPLPGGRRLGLLPPTVAAIAFLAVLAVAAALGLTRAAATIEAAGAGRLTVELVDADVTRLDAAAARLRARLAADGSVAEATRVPQSEIAALLAPTLGRALDGLPLPALIEVRLRDGADERAVASLAAREPAARLIRARDDLRPLVRLMGVLRGLAWALAALALAVTILLAVLAARAALEAHRQTLAVLHALGASDRDLARLMERRIARDALIGGAIGYGAAIAAGTLVEARLAAALAPGAGMPAIGWPLLAFVPVLLAAAAALATRAAVLATLARAP